MQPEEKARLIIDAKLKEAGWTIQDIKEFNPFASKGVAVREFQTNDGDKVDYALFVDGIPVGLIEAKPDESGVLLSSAACEQNLKYAKSGLKGNYDKEMLRFLYEATGLITEFTDLYDPKPRLRKIYSFHRPEHLKALMDDYRLNGNKTLRARLKDFPELPSAGFRDCQISAIKSLEASFAKNHPRALVQMATGAGKTYTAITNTYRLLKHGKAKRILFLVDTKNLGEQAEMEYKNFISYDTTSKLSELYNIQRITTSNIPQETQICISTIQRLYSMLKGDISTFPDDADEEEMAATGDPREIVYNPEYPPEFFDFIIIDECHRSIYNLWRQVLEYFDAFLIGLTATPSSHTYAFFNENVVSEYTHEQAVADNVNVGAFATFVIETEKTKKGGRVARIHQQLEVRDKRTRLQKWQSADEDLSYSGRDLDNSVVSKSQIRLVLQTFRDSWRKWMYFRDREELPKTLIFAKNDSHAADIVEIAKDVFGEGNDFCKKITYTTEENEQSLLYAFRNEFYPRIAVTVTKIATGTDVKAIEILLFMRDIKSENFYEQMLGRARRTLGAEDLRKASPSAKSDKLGYVIVDAVGVTKTEKTSRGKGGADTKQSVSFKKLMQNIITNDTSEETFASFATRLERLEKVLNDNERNRFKELSGNVSVRQLAAALKAAHDIDLIESEMRGRMSEKDYMAMSPQEKDNLRKDVIAKRCREAAMPLFNPEVRKYLMTVRNSNEQTIDPALDSLISADFDDKVHLDKEKVRESFREFIDRYRDEIMALQIIYNQDYRNRHITESMIHQLYFRMTEHNRALNETIIFAAYEDRTKKKSMFRELMDIIQVIRYEWKQISDLVPYADRVRLKYKDWLFEKNKNKGGARGADTVPFTAEQLSWLEMIRDFIAKNGSIEPEDFDYGDFLVNGGFDKFYSLFKDKYEIIINELNEALAA
ncbi:MAG: DEAD/DEAH box helicase family protein [Duncaniella sp.]|uniref:type I restriction endonuclease subunit R n=1 Tax=Duncaniella sp. TaxID=2518496 RepID=UPI0023CC65C7|nr:DEAD/DEAH box helicase family protein [Duncaniella sp.]MDE5988695.1 DEAD/DEAH box helicase family protein [Duncaniella sp.]